MEDKYVPATEFKANCLRLMDEVAKQRRPIVITKRGKPVAKLVPIPAEDRPQRLGLLTHIKPPPESFFFDPLPEDELRLWGESSEDDHSR